MSKTVSTLAVLVAVCLPATASAQLPEKSEWRGITWLWRWWPDKQYEGPTVCGVGVPISPYCQHEFDVWKTRELKWREIKRYWANMTRWNDWPVPRASRPVVPWWMRNRCLPEESLTTKSTICAHYFEAIDYDWVLHHEGPEAFTRYTATGPPSGGGGRFKFTFEGRSIKEFLLDNTHYDQLINSSNLTSAAGEVREWGFFGTHLTIAKFGDRIFLWPFPGFLVIRHPGGDIKMKMTYGIDIYLFDIPLSRGQNKRVIPLYFTAVKVFNATEAEAIRRGVNSGKDFMGISITLSK